MSIYYSHSTQYTGALLGNGEADLQAAVELVQESNPYYGDSDEETEYVFSDTNTSSSGAAAGAVVESGDKTGEAGGEVSSFIHLMSCVHLWQDF